MTSTALQQDIMVDDKQNNNRQQTAVEVEVRKTMDEGSNEITTKPTTAKELVNGSAKSQVISEPETSTSTMEIAIKPTLDIDDIQAPNRSTSDFEAGVQSASRSAVKDPSSITFKSYSDATETLVQSQIQTSEDIEGPDDSTPITIKPTTSLPNTSKSTTESGTSNIAHAAGGRTSNTKVATKPCDETDFGPKITPTDKITRDKNMLIPARKRKSKKRLSSFKQWITCSRVPREEYEDVPPESSHTSGSSISQASGPQVVKIRSISDAFIHYNHDNQTSQRPHGRGMCVIFTLFTDELTGYIKDRSAAFNFFHGVLGYDVYADSQGFMNCSRAELMSSIRQLQRVIANKALEDNPYDRLVMLIMTHGEKGGLMTCQAGSAIFEETRSVQQPNKTWKQERVLTKIEEICDMFKHDQVPALKDKPKMFLIQACRGSDDLKFAGPQAQTMERPEYDLSNLKLRPEVPVDADTIVYYATTPDHESWVSPQLGSWFIEKTLHIFEKHHSERHVEEMMTLINLIISNERGKTVKDGRLFEVAQMPCKFSTLRMAFYL